MISRRNLLIGSAFAAPAILRARRPALALNPALIGPNQFPLPRWAAAKALALNGTRNAKLAIVGTSIDAGKGADGNAYVGAFANAWGTQLAQQKTSAALPWSSSSFFCDANFSSSPSDITAYDPRRAFSGGWGINPPGAVSFGGNFFLSSATGTLSFTPTNQISGFDIWYPIGTGFGFGTMTVNVNGGASLGTINQNTGSAAGGYAKTSFTCTLGTNTINCVWASATVFVAGIVAYNTAAKEVSVYNGGIDGALTADWTASTGMGWDPVPAIAALAPDLTVIDLTVNDWCASTSPASFLSNTVALIENSKLSGDVLLITDPPTQPASTGGTGCSAACPAPQIQAIYNGLYALVSRQYNLPILNLTTGVFKSWGVASGLGEVWDSLHYDDLGYTKMAAAVAPYV